MKDRTTKLLSGIDPSNQKGLEIGAFAYPIIKKEMGDIRYVDYDTTEGLREKVKSWGWDAASIEKIVTVDFVWGEKSLSEITAGNGPYDYVIASHVIEHVPDLIGWLREVRSVLKPGGIFSVAIPDKRFTFDYYRRTTNLSDIIGAFLQHSRKPDFSQIFDYNAKYDYVWDCYRENVNITHENKLKKAWDIVKEAHENMQYVDVHCWIFTDMSFLNLLADMNTLDLLDFEVMNVFETNGNEFFVNFKATDFKLNINEKRTIQAKSIKNAQAFFSKKYFFRKIIDPRFWPQYRAIRMIKKKILK